MRGLTLSLVFVVVTIVLMIVGLFAQLPGLMIVSMFCAGPLAMLALGFALARVTAGKRFIVEDRSAPRAGHRSVRPAAPPV